MTGILYRKEIKIKVKQAHERRIEVLTEWCGDTCVHNFSLETTMEESDIILGIIKRRRSVRHFNREKIPGEYMEQILEAGRWAPSGANAQPWRFIVVTNRETLAAIAERCFYKIFKSRHVAEAGAVVVICADPYSGSRTYPLDAAIAGTNMTLMATSLGIGSCWIGAFEEQAIKNLLHIPEKLKVIALIAFGYEVGKASVPPRLPLSSIVHYEAYDDRNEPGIITKNKASGPLSVFGKLMRVLFNRR